MILWRQVLVKHRVLHVLAKHQVGWPIAFVLLSHGGTLQLFVQRIFLACIQSIVKQLPVLAKSGACPEAGPNHSGMRGFRSNFLPTSRFGAKMGGRWPSWSTAVLQVSEVSLLQWRRSQ